MTYDLEGYFGGFDSQNDNALLEIEFFDALSGGSSLGTVSVGGVTAADRGNETGLLFRDTNGLVPTSARRIDVELTMTRTAGSSNDGYADNLSLQIDLPPNGNAVIPEPTTFVVWSLLGLTATGARRHRRHTA